MCKEPWEQWCLQQAVNHPPSNQEVYEDPGDRAPMDLDHQDQEANSPQNHPLDPLPQDEHYDGAGIGVDGGEHLFEAFRRKTGHRRNTHYPFVNQEEFEVAEWLNASGMSMDDTEKFFKLSWVSPVSLAGE